MMMKNSQWFSIFALATIPAGSMAADIFEDFNTVGTGQFGWLTQTGAFSDGATASSDANGGYCLKMVGTSANNLEAQRLYKGYTSTVSGPCIWEFDFKLHGEASGTYSMRSRLGGSGDGLASQITAGGVASVPNGAGFKYVPILCSYQSPGLIDWHDNGAGLSVGNWYRWRALIDANGKVTGPWIYDSTSSAVRSSGLTKSVKGAPSATPAIGSVAFGVGDMCLTGNGWSVDNLRISQVSGTGAGVIFGACAVQGLRPPDAGFTPIHQGQLVLVDENPDPDVPTTLSLQQDGGFPARVYFATKVAAGTYSVFVRWRTGLWTKVASRQLVDSEHPLVVSADLVNGDVDSDNVVSVFDYIEVSDHFDASFGDSNYSSICDLDQDGVTSVFDYIILSDSFDLAGDVVTW